MSRKDKAEQAIEKKADVVYTREELMENAAALGVKPEIVAGALRLVGKNTLTKAEAEQAIKAFLQREV